MTGWKSTKHCRDCGVNTFAAGEYYTIRDHIWAAAGMERLDGCLCIGCLEDRPGRALTSADFPPWPVNRLTGAENRRRSARLLARLRDGAPVQLALF